MSVEVRLAFLGGATIYQGDHRFEATAALFAEGHPPNHSWFGNYESATPDGVASGTAVIRFSDGSEAEAAWPPWTLIEAALG